MSFSFGESEATQRLQRIPADIYNANFPHQIVPFVFCSFIFLRNLLIFTYSQGEFYLLKFRAKKHKKQIDYSKASRRLFVSVIFPAL